jgi:hypothetical protein
VVAVVLQAAALLAVAAEAGEQATAQLPQAVLRVAAVVDARLVLRHRSNR